MQLSELFDLERGNLMILILSAIVWGLIKINGLFCLVEINDIENAFAIGLLASYIVYFILLILWQRYCVIGRIKINVTKNPLVESVAQGKMTGKRFYGSLDVVIPKNWVAEECYVFVDEMKPKYFKNQVALEEQIAEWFAGVTAPEYRMLTWKSMMSERLNTKINIGENSNKETFFIGQVTTGKLFDDYGNEGDIDAFEFCHPKKEGEIISHYRSGLYEFSLLFNWKRNGKRMIKKKIKGYIYSSKKEGERKITVGLGDYRNDEAIPEPL